MPPRRKLSDLDRGRAIGWLQQDGVAARQVAQRLAVAPSVIIRLKQRFQATGRVQERQRSGRPRVTTQREDRFIQRQAMQHRSARANNIRQRLQATTNTVVSGQTIRNRLHNFGLRVSCRIHGIAEFAESATFLSISRNRQNAAQYVKSAAFCRNRVKASKICPFCEIGSHFLVLKFSKAWDIITLRQLDTPMDRYRNNR
ncbi:hypothetical protein V1264_024309 [Littorina saxatilis]|uniref:Transposase Tc1-like domain-containing protein n=1 Tax=Littorina saxatilis TaxID=31220 RepID=A0AAN9AL85_9CAEN